MSTINDINYQHTEIFFIKKHKYFIIDPLFQEFFDNFQCYFNNNQDNNQDVQQIIKLPTIEKKEFLKDLPAYLNKPRTKKASYIKTWPNEITEQMFYNLLQMQTEGCEFHTFEYYILKHGLQTDNNNMIIFTKEFPFDNKIKKEALFIWGIFNYIKHHPILKNFLQYMTYTFQERIGLGSHNKKTKEYDTCIPNLQLIIEIDENHNTSDPNDELKSDIIQENGFRLIRLDFQKIYNDNNDNNNNDGIGKGKGEICSGENANKYLLNSKYYKEFLNNLSYVFLCALLKNYADVREYYINIIFRQMLHQRLSNINNCIIENISEISLYEERMQTATTMYNYNDFYRERENIKKSVDYNILYKRDLQKLINSLSTPDYKEMLIAKDICKRANYAAVIDYIRLNKIVKIIDQIAFVTFLCQHGIIKNINIDITSVMFTWKQLCLIISKLGIKKEIQELLFMYYLEIEESYEKIIILINEHTDSLQGNPKSYNACVRYIEMKYKSKYELRERRMKDNYHKLTEEYTMMKYNCNISCNLNDKSIDMGEYIDIEYTEYIKNKAEKMISDHLANENPPSFSGIIDNIEDNIEYEPTINSDGELSNDEIDISDHD
jgi:hypothetical protein